MREFFRGWRRKVGCITLLMACLLMGAWVRSGIQYDFISFYFPGMYYRIGTHGSNVRLMRFGPPNSAAPVPWNWDVQNMEWTWESGPVEWLLPYTPNGSRDPWYGYAVDWRWDFLQFYIGSGLSHENMQRESMCSIPYWSMALPLTLLSAWLILKKPQKKVATPNPREVPDA